MLKPVLFSSLVASLAAVTGCADSQLETTATRFEGIYSIDSHTENLAACAPGAEIAVAQKFAIAWYSDRAFPVGLRFATCDSPDDCRALRDADERGEGIVAELILGASEEHDGALRGAEVSTGFADGATCRMGELTRVELTLAGAALTIRQEHTIAPDYPASNGFCTTDQTRDLVEGVECSQLDIVTATRIDAL